MGFESDLQGMLPPIGLESDYQGPIDLGLGLPPLDPVGPGMPMPGFLSSQMPDGNAPVLDMACDIAPSSWHLAPDGGVLPSIAGPSEVPTMVDVPPGLPPGFPPIGDMPLGLPPGLPPGFPPGFAPPGSEPVFGPSGPMGAGPPEGPGRPEFVTASGIAIGPPPSEPPPPTRQPMETGWQPAAASEADRKRKRGRTDGLASNKNIKGGGSVTVYNGYESQTTAAVAGSTRKASSSSAPAVAAAVAAAAAPNFARASSSQGQEALPRQLPEGWEMKKSRSTGKVYYINEKLGKSQFDPPQGSTVKAVSPQKKKQKSVHRPKDVAGATMTSMNGVTGVVRAKDQNANRWAKWQKCSQVVNTEPERNDD